MVGVDRFRLVPWTWEKLKPPSHPHGFVVFHGDDINTARGLARMATILASYHRALPLAVKILPPGRQLPKHLFRTEHEEVHTMGYSLATELVPEKDLAAGLVTAAEYYEAHALVLAYPLQEGEREFGLLLDTVCRHLFCPLVVVRFLGEIHTERILIPISDLEELRVMYPVICGLAAVGEHQLKLLYMMSPTEGELERVEKKDEVLQWLQERDGAAGVDIDIVAAESRLQAIKREAEGADLVVMAADETSTVQRFLFGSLVDMVAKTIRTNLVVVYSGKKKI